MKMGSVFGKCFGRTERQIVLLLVGLDNAGKSRTAYHLTGRERDVAPTVGFQAVSLTHKGRPVTLYDLGGGPQFRAIWDQYYADVHGVIFVVDSSDPRRLEECRHVLDGLLSHERIAGKPVLILANKQDLAGAMDDLELVEKLNVEAVVNRCRCPTRVEAYTAKGLQGKLDPGLHKGYVWLLTYVERHYGQLNLRVQTDGNTDRLRRKAAQASPPAEPSKVIVVKEAPPSHSPAGRSWRKLPPIRVGPLGAAGPHSTVTLPPIVRSTKSATVSLGEADYNWAAPQGGRALSASHLDWSPANRKLSLKGQGRKRQREDGTIFCYEPPSKVYNAEHPAGDFHTKTEPVPY